MECWNAWERGTLELSFDQLEAADDSFKVGDVFVVIMPQRGTVAQIIKVISVDKTVIQRFEL